MTRHTFLPLLNPKDALTTLEILSFGFKIPDLIIYKKQSAFMFRKAILFQFTEEIFLDVVHVIQLSKPMKQHILNQMSYRVGDYSPDDLVLGIQWLDACILAVTVDIDFDCMIQRWSEREHLHWRLYIAQLLIERG